MKTIDEIEERQEELLRRCDRLEEGQEMFDYVLGKSREYLYRYEREKRKRLHAQRRLQLISQAIDLQGWAIGRNL